MGLLHFHVIDLPDTSLNKTAVLVTGPHQAMLIDAGFTRSDGHRLVEAVHQADKALTRVFVSHSDPDFFFGSAVVQDAFPEAEFIATEPVVQRIKDGYDDQLEAWAHLEAELPERLVLPEPLPGDTLDFEGRTFELRGGHPALPDRHYLWQEHHKAVLGGVLLYDGLHVWTADTPSREQRAAWVDVLNGMEALAPTFVVAGHRRAGGPTDATPITFTTEYLKVFEEELERSPDAATAQAALEALYPDAGLPMAVSLGTKAAKGEITWA